MLAIKTSCFALLHFCLQKMLLFQIMNCWLHSTVQHVKLESTEMRLPICVPASNSSWQNTWAASATKIIFPYAYIIIILIHDLGRPMIRNLLTLISMFSSLACVPIALVSAPSVSWLFPKSGIGFVWKYS